jgi:hypothetical protein
VVAAFGVLLSVLETRLGITSGMHHTERVHQCPATSGHFFFTKTQNNLRFG